jgi:Trypsin
MKLIKALMVLFMTIPALAQINDWEKFNSSLLIEVTRPHGVFTCTGVAVSNKIILTAAHCLEGNVKSVRIFIKDKYDPSHASLEISGFKIHPNYDGSRSRYKSDLAKIILSEKLPPEISIYPIKRGTKLFGNMIRFGFGMRNSQNVRTAITPTLRRLNIEEEILELNDEYSRSGDSGGPVYLQYGNEITVLAIHSTFSFGPEGSYSLNPLLEAYIPWIFAN